MEILTKKFEEILYIPNSIIDLIKNNKVCFFDIETTGFNRKTNKVILIGMLYKEDKNIVIKQYFANNFDEEVEILKCFINDLKNFKYYINFNGDTFDIPFLNERLKYNNINFLISKDYSIDILKYIKKKKNILKLDNYKLKTIEKFLNIKREDKISGKDSVKMYLDYLNSQNKDLKKIILKHNYDDIYYLSKVLKIFDTIDDYEKIRIDIEIFEKIIFCVNINNVKIKDNKLKISGISDKVNIMDQIYYENNYSFRWFPELGNFDFQIDVQLGLLSNNKKVYYINKNDFDFNIDFIDKTDHNIPNELIILKEGNSLCISNIKFLIEIFMYKNLNKIKKTLIE